MVEITTKTETNINVEPLSGPMAIEYGNKAKQHAISAVENAIKCGEQLVQVKKELPHGEFTDWIKQNMPVTDRQCQKFMSISSYLIESKTELGSVLEYDKSINELAAEASEYKLRERARAQAKKQPKKEDNGGPELVELRLDKEDFKQKPIEEES